MFCDICNNVKAIHSDLLVDEVYEKRDDYVDKLEALNHVVLVRPHESQVPNDEHDHPKVLDQL
jgi:hypothetical protein